MQELKLIKIKICKEDIGRLCKEDIVRLIKRGMGTIAIDKENYSDILLDIIDDVNWYLKVIFAKHTVPENLVKFAIDDVLECSKIKNECVYTFSDVKLGVQRALINAIQYGKNIIQCPELEMTDDMLRRNDEIDNTVYHCICTLAEKEIEWDMYKIHEVTEAIINTLKEFSIEVRQPYIATDPDGNQYYGDVFKFGDSMKEVKL